LDTPRNPRPDRVLEKSGLRIEGTIREKAWFKKKFHDLRIFGRIAGDRWREQSALGKRFQPLPTEKQSRAIAAVVDHPSPRLI